jgi:hypothetical protein
MYTRIYWETLKGILEKWGVGVWIGFAQGEGAVAGSYEGRTFGFLAR